MTPSPFSLLPSQQVWTSTVHREVLPNGLTVLVQEDHSAPAVAVVTHVKAGFFDEPDRWVGVSHVLEHMFFKGTARRGVGAIARETKSAGGYLNASTTYDHTSYFTVLPASGLEAALDIQSDALRHSLIDGDELARELQVIIQEAKRKLDTPSALTHETLHEVMFDRHRIRRWRIGHESQLAGYTRGDLQDYYSSRYVPDRTIISIVGAVDAGQALALARRAYGDWPAAAGAVDPSPDEPPRRGVRARTLRGDVARAELVVGWRTVAALHPDSPALDLGAAVLGSGKGSRLYRRLREPGIVSWVSAHHYAPTELGVMSLSVEVAPERVEEALAGIAESVTQLALLGPSRLDVDRARTLLRARWARRMESMEGRAASLAEAEALDGYQLLDREYAALASVEPEEVQEATERYLHPDSVSGVLYLPTGEGEDLTDQSLARAFAVTPLAAVGTAAPLRPLPRPPQSVHSRREGNVHHTPLPGVDLLVWRKPGVPLASIGIYVPRSRLDPAEQAGIGALTARAATRGAAGLDAGGLAFAFEGLGGSLGASAASDWLGFGTTVLAEHLPEAAVLLDSVFSEPHLDDTSVALERGVMVAEAEQVTDDMFRYPFQLAFAEGFGEDGYGLPVSGLPGTLSAVSGADVRAWHQHAFREMRPVVVAVGDLDPERASALLAGAFGTHGEIAAPPTLTPLAWVGEGGGDTASRVVLRERAQAALAMAFPGPSRRDAGHAAAEVWAAVASGLGGRLFEALRDRRSLAYTVVASAWQKARAGALLAYIATSPEREEEAREEMLKELDRFTREPVSETELRQAINYLSGQAEVSRQSGVAVAGEILEAWISGTGLRQLEDPGASYRSITAEDVQRVASEHLDRARRVEGVVRGRTATGVS